MLVVIMMELGKDGLAHGLNRGKHPDNHMADIKENGKQAGLALWEHTGQECIDQLRPPSYPDIDLYWSVS